MARDGKIQAIRDAARGQSCIRCGAGSETVVCAHYSGPRRSAYGGGLGEKVHDLISCHLCGQCHSWIDTLGKDKDDKWILSEELLHLVALTIIRLYSQGIIIVKGDGKNKMSK